MQTTELIAAMDVPDSDTLRKISTTLPNQLKWLKIGLELYCAEGPRALDAAHEEGRHVFLDLKLHDIPRTVERAVRAAARHRVRMLTVHAGGGRTMLEAAVRGAREFGQDAPKIIAVTVLTSLNDEDLREVGVGTRTREQVLRLSELALAAGADGLVCSSQEVTDLRKRFGHAPLLIVPGIRSGGEAAGDQKRTASAAEATRDGASYLVVGRPILGSPDPASAVLRLLEEIRTVP